MISTTPPSTANTPTPSDISDVSNVSEASTSSAQSQRSPPKRRYAFHTWLFNTFARGFQWIYRSQVKFYSELLTQYVSELNLPEGARILDVGCGPGGFGKAFQNWGFEVYGIDVAPRMVNLANKNGIQAFQGSILDQLQYPTNTFDLIIAANLLHGFQYPERLQIYQEMARVSKGKVLFHEVFQEVQIFKQKNSFSSWYLCRM